MTLRNIVRLETAGAIMFFALAFYMPDMFGTFLLISVACLAAAAARKDHVLEQRKVE